MPLTIVSDRPVILALVAKALKASPGRDIKVVVRKALQKHYDLTDEDGIYGGSDAAICLGYRGHGEDENLMDEIIKDLAAEARSST